MNIITLNTFISKTVITTIILSLLIFVGCSKTEKDSDSDSGISVRSIDTDGDGFIDAVDCEPEDEELWRKVVVYEDNDLDGHGAGDSTTVCSGLELPEGYSFIKDDCDDGNSLVYICDPNLLDSDNDGVADSIDCDDEDSSVYFSMSAFIDADNDNYGVGEIQEICTNGTLPPGYTFTFGDCDDTTSAKWRLMVYTYTDLDDDTITVQANGNICTGLELPAGYILYKKGEDNCPNVANTDQADFDNDGVGDLCDTDIDNDGVANENDCAPNDASLYQIIEGYLDSDADGHGVGELQQVCTGGTLPPEYTTNNNTDCDDNIMTRFQLLLGYVDGDGDGYGAGEILQVCSGETLLTGYVTNNTDCNGNDGQLYQNLHGYEDGDHDGYGSGNLVQVCSGETLLTGYVENNSDCDDNSKALYQILEGYVDNDRDSFGVGELIQVCSGSSLPEGYTIDNNTDCDDNNNALFQILQGYLDSDGDGYGVGELIQVCSGNALPQGYTNNNNTDCDDNNNALFQILQGYLDSDGDGNGVGDLIQQICSGTTLPEGFSINNLDCYGNDPYILNCDIETKLLASDGQSGDGFGSKVAIDGNIAVVGAPYGSEGGSAYIHKLNDQTNEWEEVAKLIPTDGAYNDRFGEAVDISGNKAIVGAHLYPGNNDINPTGSVYIFTFNGESWVETKLINPTMNRSFGGAVAISDNTAIVGASNFSSKGSVYIFKFNSQTNVWEEPTILTPSDSAQNDLFGASVSIDGNTVIVGSPGQSVTHVEFSGGAYIFKFNGESWVETKLIYTITSHDYGDRFGSSVSISGNTAIVGAPRAGYINNAGRAYIYTFNQVTSNWDKTRLIKSYGGTWKLFGVSVAISGNTAIVGDYGSYKAGNTSIFRFNEMTSEWLETTITSSDSSPGDRFGSSVSISGNKTIAGACSDDDNGDFSGSAYIYDIDQTE